jgi:dTDP-4-dehydrorhamnose 3,5-epimerase
VFDVAVDIRVGSPTFGKWVGATLSEDRPQLVWIPPGFAHGFCALSEGAVIHYKCSELYDPSDERGIVWSDPDLAIEWPLTQPIVSTRDRDLPRLRAVQPELPRFARALERVGST